MLTGERITHFSIYYTQKITQSNSSREKVARKTFTRRCPVRRFFDFFLRTRKEKTKYFNKNALKLAKSKIRLVLHLFVFACSFREQNLPRASFASSVKNEFVSSGTLLRFAHPNPARFDFISQFCRKVCKGFLRNDYGTDDLSAPSFFVFQTCKCQEFLTGEPAVGLVYIESERSLW